MSREENTKKKEEITKLETEITAYVDNYGVSDITLMGSKYFGSNTETRRMFHNYYLAETLYEAGWRKETAPKEATISTAKAREILKSFGEYIKGEFKSNFNYPIPNVMADKIDTIINGLVKENK